MGNGVDLSGGEYTLLAPANSAFDKHNTEVGTPIDADVLKYHVIEGKKTMDALNSDQKTLNGGTLTYYRKFRKNWLDYAIIGLKLRARPSRPTGRRTSSAATASSTPSTRSSCRAPTRAPAKRDLHRPVLTRTSGESFSVADRLAAPRLDIGCVMGIYI